MTDEILKYIADFLDKPVEEITADKTLEQLGMDSLDFMDVLFEVEERFDIRIPDDLPESHATMRTLGDVLELVSRLIEEKNGVASNED